MGDFPAHLFVMAGDPSAVRASAGKWSGFGTAASDAAGEIGRVDTFEFVGTEGDLFRDGLKGDLPAHLLTTGDAFGRVSSALRTFAGTLESLQDQMRPVSGRAPGLWQALQAAQGRVSKAKTADDQHAKDVAAQANDPAASSQPDTYQSDATASASALGTAQRQWQDCVDAANGLRGQLATAVSTAVREIHTAKDMRFKENPKWYDIGGQFTDFVRDNKDLLKKLSGALKIVSLVAGLLSFIPILAPICGPIAIGSALLASAIDLSIYAATGEGSLKMILIDVGLNLLPGVGKLARLGMGALKGTKVALAFASMAGRSRNMMSLAKWGLSAPRLNGLEALKRLTRLDPIDIASGDMIVGQTDVDLPGVLPLVLSRTHVSSYRLGSWFGRSWASTLDQRVEVDDQGVYFATADAMTLIYPPPSTSDTAPSGTAVLPSEGPRWPLTTVDDEYRVSDPYRGWTWHFAPMPDQNRLVVLPAGQRPLTAITDRAGHRIDILRDADGTPVEVVHSGGYRVRVHTETNRVVALSLHDSAADDDTVLLRFAYNDYGDLTDIINSSGLPQRFEYDGDGRIVAWTDRNHTTYRYTYDVDGRCVATDGTGGTLTGALRYELDQATGRRTTTVTDSLGHDTVYHINRHIQVEAVTDPLGNTTRGTWDRYDRKLSGTDPLGRTTSYRYDDRGNVIEITRPDNTRAAFGYNEFNQPLTIVDFDGGIWHRSYDERGNLTTVTDPSGSSTHYTYDERGHIDAVIDALGARRRIDTDAAGLPVRGVDPLGAVTAYTRDAAGRITAITDPTGATTIIGYTVEGKPASRHLPDGATERWTYDGEGNLVRHDDQIGQVTRFEVGPFDLTGARTDPDGGRFVFRYDTELRLRTVTNADGLAWRYEYDAAGHLVRETDFNGRALGYAYDAAGQLIRRTNGIGQAIEYDHDLVGNVTSKRTPDSVTTFAYDPSRRLLAAANDDAELRLTRDPMGRVLSETYGGRTTQFSYDALGRRVARRTPSGARSHWEYDAASRPVALRTGGQTVQLSYDAAGRETSRRYGADLVLDQAWDANERLLSQTWSITDAVSRGEVPGEPGIGTGGGAGLVGPARVVHSRAYSYRADGYLTGVADHLNGERRFSLDAGNRVTAVTGATWTERYAYDVNGNITSATWPDTADGAAVLGGATVQAGSDERLDEELRGDRGYAGTLIRQAGRVRFEHDGQGRVVLRQHTRRSAEPRTWHYTWDAEDRLVSTSTPDGQRWRHRYDPLGRRISKQRLDRDGTVSEQVDFSWDGTVLAEQTTATPEGGRRATVWDWTPATFVPVAQAHRVSGRDAPQDWIDEQFYAIVTDLAGAPTELVRTDGTIAWHNRANVWGSRPAAAGVGVGVDCPLGFPGQYYDAESQTFYNYYRHYDAATGRYLSPDPIGLAAAPNPHGYVSNPLHWSDPYGLAPYKVLYHGAQDFQGDKFVLQTAIDAKRAGTPVAGVHLTDDFTRAATGYGRGGQVVRVQVPQEFADSVYQLGGPAGNQPEFFVNTPGGIEVLNNGITDIAPTMEATTRFFQGLF
jgi:RHS repeat-associated protein